MPPALRTIRAEHLNLACMLTCLHHLVAGLERKEVEPSFDILFSMLVYLEGFPDTLHHPKEERFLFTALRERRADAAELIDQLCEEHRRVAALLREFRHALEAYHRDPSARERFVRAADDYLDAECAHMEREERDMFPLALECLEDNDWRSLNAAFRSNADTLFGAARERQFENLFEFIMEGREYA
jgi:hemerythrin-like domain-containing protein